MALKFNIGMTFQYTFAMIRSSIGPPESLSARYSRHVVSILKTLEVLAAAAGPPYSHQQ